MNNTFRYLVYASLASLLAAMLGGLWLVWHSIGESRELERRNRELQASLEASRIRVENFCEYPSDVLCRVDERSGTVAGALPGELPGLAELTGASSQPETQKEAGIPEASPAKAVENVQKVAKAQASLAVPAEKEAPAPVSTPPVQEKPEPAKPAGKLEAASADKTAPAAAQTEQTEKGETPAPEKNAGPSEPETSSPAPVTEQKEDGKTPPAPVQAAPAASPEPAAPQAGSASALPSYTQEVSGKLTVEPVEALPSEAKPAPAENPTDKRSAEKADAGTSIKKSSPQPQAATRSSWSRIDKDGDIFVFTLTGAGSSLKAEGALRSSPWRYELVLDGLFDVRPHPGIEDRLVRSVSSTARNGKTVIVFKLKGKPYKCSLHRQDERTVAVRIR